jgi:hypothetical protein
LSQFSRKISKTQSADGSEGDEVMDLSIDFEIKGQLDMLEAELNGEGVGDEEPVVDSDDEDEVAGDVASSDAAAVTDIIHNAEASIRLDPLPLAEANIGCVSIAKVSP